MATINYTVEANGEDGWRVVRETNYGYGTRIIAHFRDRSDAQRLAQRLEDRAIEAINSHVASNDVAERQAKALERIANSLALVAEHLTGIGEES